MCVVCFRINVRKKFRIKNLHTLPNKTDGKAAINVGRRHFCRHAQTMCRSDVGKFVLSFLFFSAEHFSLSNSFPYMRVWMGYND